MKAIRYLVLDLKTGKFGVLTTKPDIKKWLEEGTDFQFVNGALLFEKDVKV